MPGLKYKRGLSEWHLATKDCSQFFSKYSEVEGTSMQSNMRPYMFPPTEEEAARFNLDRCMRVLPHLQVWKKCSQRQLTFYKHLYRVTILRGYIPPLTWFWYFWHLVGRNCS